MKEAIVGPLSNFFSEFRRGAARRSTARSLRRLSREQLSDIGVLPDGIDDLVDAMLAVEGVGGASKPTSLPRRPSAQAVWVPGQLQRA